MIRTALEFIRKELEAYMVDREQDPIHYNTGNVVDLKPVALPNGTLNINNNSHISLMLIGLDEERREGKRPVYLPIEDKQFARLHAPVEIDLFLMFAAHNASYETSLRDLSSVLCFFQANPVFDAQHFPALNDAAKEPATKPWQLIERLSFRMHNLGFEQHNNIWSMLGTKYLPNVLYKVNMLTVFETKAKEKAPAINEMNIN